MARTSITVTPNELRTASSKIDGYSNDYKQLYKNLYKVISDMQTFWEGKDNLAYINQINGFESSFENMKLKMDDYSNFLKRAANAYSDTQTEIERRAKGLRN
jgi:WXG100 family type VII secretion target